MSALRVFRLVAMSWLACAAGSKLEGAPPLTQIQDVLYKADGTTFTGTAVVTWKAFTAADSSNIPSNSVSVPIVSGLLRVRLVPTTNASANAYYTVRYNSEGKTQFTELWAVPPSPAAIPVKDIRISVPPGGTKPPPETSIQISDVEGLSAALAERPVKGPAYVNGRAAAIDSFGLLNGASGVAGDCLRVDGTSGPCGVSNMTSQGYVDMETPAGALNGVNAVFLLGQTPSPAGSLQLFRNGILQSAGVDFTLNGNAITFVAAATPQTGDVLRASYRLP